MRPPATASAARTCRCPARCPIWCCGAGTRRAACPSRRQAARRARTAARSFSSPKCCRSRPPARRSRPPSAVVLVALLLEKLRSECEIDALLDCRPLVILDVDRAGEGDELRVEAVL